MPVILERDWIIADYLISNSGEKEKEKADKDIKSLMKDKFNSMSAAMEVAHRFSMSLMYHQLTNIQVQKIGSTEPVM